MMGCAFCTSLESVRRGWPATKIRKVVNKATVPVSMTIGTDQTVVDDAQPIVEHSVIPQALETKGMTIGHTM